MALGDEIVAAALADWQTAPLDERVRATLAFLQRVTLAPETVGPGDVEPLREAGVRREGVLDALAICLLFNTIVRVADALGFEPLSRSVSAEEFVAHETAMLQHGYL